MEVTLEVVDRDGLGLPEPVAVLVRHRVKVKGLVEGMGVIEEEKDTFPVAESEGEAERESHVVKVALAVNDTAEERDAEGDRESLKEPDTDPDTLGDCEGERVTEGERVVFGEAEGVTP